MDLLKSLPIGLYLEQPVTWLHRVDPRVKLGWLVSVLLAPVLSSAPWRIGLVLFLIGLTISARIPLRVWRQQMGFLLALATLVTVLLMVMPDGIAVVQNPRLPTPELLQPLGSEVATTPGQAVLPPTAYQYVLLDWGVIQVTQQSVQLAIRVGTLLFTLVYSTTLFLLTTAPEEITAGLEDLMQPLRWLKLPVTEIALTLTLALRFIPLVLEEVQNLIRSIRTRAINWRKLGMRRAAQIWILVAERLLGNLLLRAEQIASAMHVRGFVGPNAHRVLWHQLRLRWWDWLLLVGLGLFWWLRFALGNPI
ncbi:MAG: CbiQ family ECF transporter T component [Cyanobacteria bacterium P01_A01_bin.105]